MPTHKSDAPETAPVVAAPPVPTLAESAQIYPYINPADWVTVRHKSSNKDDPTGSMTRAYFDGWGKDLGWQEVK